jgi:outer membrane protein
VDEGQFVLFGTEFESPQSRNTGYSWDVTHSLLDSGRDLFRLKSARANVDQAIAGYDLQSLTTATQIETQYLEARRQQALVNRALFEVEQRKQQLALAQGRYDVGAVTRSDVLLARLELNRAEVAVLLAGQRLEEARLALRSLLGGALPDRPIELTTTFQVFQPGYDLQDLVARALAEHPSLRETRAQQQADAAQLWMARSAYLPSLRSSTASSCTSADVRFQVLRILRAELVGLALNWQIFGGFERTTRRARRTRPSSRHAPKRSAARSRSRKTSGPHPAHGLRQPPGGAPPSSWRARTCGSRPGIEPAPDPSLTWSTRGHAQPWRTPS